MDQVAAGATLGIGIPMTMATVGPALGIKGTWEGLVASTAWEFGGSLLSGDMGNFDYADAAGGAVFGFWGSLAQGAMLDVQADGTYARVPLAYYRSQT